MTGTAVVAAIAVDPSPVDEPTPLTFVQVPHRACELPSHERDALIGLLRFVRGIPRCWPKQATLARVVGKSRPAVAFGLRALEQRGVITITHWSDRKGRRCTYQIADGFWVPPRQRRGDFVNELTNIEKDNQPKEKGPPRTPPQAEGSAPAIPDQVVEEVAAAAPPTDYAGRRKGEPAYRNRQPRWDRPAIRPAAPPRRRRESGEDILEGFADALEERRRRYGTPAAERDATPPSLPPPAEVSPPIINEDGEVIPFPSRQPSPRQRRAGFSTPKTEMMEAFYHAALERAARRRDRGDHLSCFSTSHRLMKRRQSARRWPRIGSKISPSLIPRSSLSRCARGAKITSGDRAFPSCGPCAARTRASPTGAKSAPWRRRRRPRTRTAREPQLDG